MRQIEKLRGGEHRTGPGLSDGAKIDTLGLLSEELGVIDLELAAQHESCVDMQNTIERMRTRLYALRDLNAPGSDELPSP